MLGLNRETTAWASRRLMDIAHSLVRSPAALRRLARLQERLYCWAYPAHSHRPHRLPGELVISLTSFPPRFPLLDFTLRSLLRQTVEPDRIILWISDADLAALPPEVQQVEGVEIRGVPDIRSYKKLVYCVQELPRSFIVTCDDDVFYIPNWLEELEQGWLNGPPSILCHRAHRLKLAEDGRLAAYRTWENDVQDQGARRPSADLLPTGLGGVLYFPESLHSDVIDEGLFQRLCPDADDLWFFWQARRQGSLYRKIGACFPGLYWPSSQDHALFSSNITRNDMQVRALEDYYGNALFE